MIIPKAVAYVVIESLKYLTDVRYNDLSIFHQQLCSQSQ